MLAFSFTSDRIFLKKTLFNFHVLPKQLPGIVLFFFSLFLFCFLFSFCAKHLLGQVFPHYHPQENKPVRCQKLHNSKPESVLWGKNRQTGLGRNVLNAWVQKIFFTKLGVLVWAVMLTPPIMCLFYEITHIVSFPFYYSLYYFKEWTAVNHPAIRSCGRQMTCHRWIHLIYPFTLLVIVLSHRTPQRNFCRVFPICIKNWKTILW